MSIIDNIIALLDEQNKQQSDLAKHLGVPKQIITDWKSGRIKSYKKYLPQIADYFDVSTDYLLGKTDIKKLPSNAIPYEYFTHTKVPIVGRVAAGVSCPPNRTRK